MPSRSEGCRLTVLMRNRWWGTGKMAHWVKHLNKSVRVCTQSSHLMKSLTVAHSYPHVPRAKQHPETEFRDTLKLPSLEHTAVNTDNERETLPQAGCRWNTSTQDCPLTFKWMPLWVCSHACGHTYEQAYTAFSLAYMIRNSFFKILMNLKA